jgi:hypothetical protein
MFAIHIPVGKDQYIHPLTGQIFCFRADVVDGGCKATVLTVRFEQNINDSLFEVIVL